MFKGIYIRHEESRLMCPGRKIIGELGKYIELDIIPQDDTISQEELSKLISEYDIVFTGWGSLPLPISLAQNPGKLKYICNMTGHMKDWVSQEFIDSEKIVVTNWGDAPARKMAEGTLALLYTMLKQIPVHIKNVRDGAVLFEGSALSGAVEDAKIGLYGLGSIGKRFMEILLFLGAEVSYYDPYAVDVPQGAVKCETLKELFSTNQIISIHAGFCESTAYTVNAEMLALLPDNGIVINTARSGIIDEPALEKELISGRLRAGIDVYGEDDILPAIDSPLRHLDNVVFTAHKVGADLWTGEYGKLNYHEKVCVDNIKRFSEGLPLRNIMDTVKYSRST